MALTFPTMAEQCLAEWRAITDRTVSLNVIASRYGAQQFKEFGGTSEWVFNDDTRIVVTGRGPNHKAVAELP